MVTPFLTSALDNVYLNRRAQSFVFRIGSNAKSGLYPMVILVIWKEPRLGMFRVEPDWPGQPQSR